MNRAHSQNRAAGFTLIELLIVVAIIAILAAIAVPNFLEAQVRSKTSRTKADMRSIATALEAYAVDWNKYPPYHYAPHNGGATGGLAAAGVGFFIGGTFSSPGSQTPDFQGAPWFGASPVTTPVAYITSMPLDVFYTSIAGEAPEARQFMYVNWDTYLENGGSQSVYDAVIRQYGKWRMTSGGPDRSRGGEPGDLFITLYDPTNGTVSLGQIHRTQLSPEGIPQI